MGVEVHLQNSAAFDEELRKLSFRYLTVALRNQDVMRSSQAFSVGQFPQETEMERFEVHPESQDDTKGTEFYRNLCKAFCIVIFFYVVATFAYTLLSQPP